MSLKNILLSALVSMPLLFNACNVTKDKDELLFEKLNNTNIAFEEMSSLKDSARSRIEYYALKNISEHGVMVAPYESIYSLADSVQARIYAKRVVDFSSFRETSEYLMAIKNIYSDLDAVEPNLKKNLELISLRELSTIEDVRTFSFTMGQVEFKDTSKISLDPDGYSFGTFVHELAHTYANTLDSSFFAEWNELVDTSGYRGDYMKDLPANGFIRSYGARGPYRHESFNGQDRWHEDIATYVEEAYADNFGNYRLVDTSDSSYIKKIDLLDKYGFISDKKYLEIKKVLGKDF